VSPHQQLRVAHQIVVDTVVFESNLADLANISPYQLSPKIIVMKTIVGGILIIGYDLNTAYKKFFSTDAHYLDLTTLKINLLLIFNQRHGRLKIWTSKNQTRETNQPLQQFDIWRF